MNGHLFKLLLVIWGVIVLTACTEPAQPTGSPLSVTASDHDGNAPERTLDGDINTRWSAIGDGAWIAYDYGKVTQLNAVKIAFHKGDQRVSTFDIETSQDGQTWSKVLTQVNSSGQTLEPERYDFKEVKAQYVKLIGYGNTSNNWNSVTEFMAANCLVEACPPQELPRVAPIKAVAASASDHDGNSPERLLDGNISTRWSANGDGAWALLDYGQVAEFDAVRLAFYKGDYRATRFDIELSTDGATWTKVLDGVNSSGAFLTHERFEFPKAKARYVKYIGHGNTQNSWNSVTEFESLNCDINACPEDEVITEAVIQAAKAALAANSSEKNDGPASTLTNWKLTLPATYAGHFGKAADGADAQLYYQRQGGTPEAAAEILPGGCSLDGASLDSTNNAYFSFDERGWHFRVPMEGGATTPNSTYIRSELREINQWQPCDEAPLANWRYGGTHKLAATLSLNEYPAKPLNKDGKTPSRPKIVLGQIHAKGVNAALAKLLWEGSNKPIRVILNQHPHKSPFSVNLGFIKDESQPWTYIIKMTDAGLELSAGGVKKVLNFGNELDNEWKAQQFYFKAGLYPQIYKASGGAFDATFSKISVEHKKRPGDFGVKVALQCDPAVSDCRCAKVDPDCQWWEAPLPTPELAAKPTPGVPPGHNFDLTSWYLSLPFDHDVNGKPDDVFEPYLAQGYQHPELFYTADDGGLVFKSYIKGVTTSENTRYVRTELREMLRRGDFSIPTQGVNQNNWVLSSAPEADQQAAGGVDGVMEATLKIDHTTTTGEPGEVGRLIIGQIHDNQDEPVRLYYRKFPGHERGSVYMAHENRLKGTDHFYNVVGDKSGGAPDPIDGIALGERFTYRIEAKGNQLKVTVMREGKPDAVTEVDMSQSGYDVGGRYLYFKAGVYNQNHTGDPQDYVQATFYKLEKSHEQYQP